MKIGQIVLSYLSDTRHTESALKTFTEGQRNVEFFVCLFQMMWKESTKAFYLHLGHCVPRQLCTCDLNNVSIRCAQSANGWTQESIPAQRAVTQMHPRWVFVDGACWCVLSPVFTRLGHERQDLLNASNEFWGNGVRTHVNSKGKLPSTGAQRRIEPVTLHHAGQRSRHTTNWAIHGPI